MEQDTDNSLTTVYSTTYPTYASGKSRWWRESMVTGNGENGALVAGAPLDDRIIYQHMMFNMPKGDLRETPELAELLETVRQSVVSMQTPRTDWNMQYDDSFHPGHSLQLQMTGSKGELRDYKRWTNYETAEVGVAYTDDYGTWERRTFASRADNVVITHLFASSEGEKVSVRLSIDDLADMNYEGSINPDLRYKRIAAEDGSYIGQVVKYPSFENSELKDGGFAGITYVVTRGGSKRRVDGGAIDDAMAISGSHDYSIEISDADEVFLITKSARDKQMCTYENFTQEKKFTLCDRLLEDVRAVAEKESYRPGGALSYEAMLAPHAALHGEEFRALTFSLDGGDDRSLSNEELLQKQRSNQDHLNPAMSERAFYAGRYAAICASGYAAPRLGGMWTGAWDCAWQADWTMDANVNLQMAGMNIGNIGWGIDGFITFLLRTIGDWETAAKSIYGMHDAIMAPSRTDGDRGGIVHFSSGYPFQYWNAGASWLLLPIYEYWLCRGDQQLPIPKDTDFDALKSVLSPRDEDYTDVEIDALLQRGYLSLERDILLPLLMKQANFWEQLMDPRYYEDAEGAFHFDPEKEALQSGERYLIIPSYSPENRPNGAYTSQITMNATMDIAAAKDGLAMAINIAKAAGRTEKVAAWEQLIEQLPVYKYDETGALREWAVYDYTENHAHRHISHTYPAWPAHESQRDAALQQGIATSIQLRKNNAQDKKSGHGWLHTGLVDARQKNANGVKEALLTLLGKNAYYTSMMTNHNVTGDSAYCTDILNTVPAVMLESLAYSGVGEVEILPALNGDWKSGRVTGIQARTRAEVAELSWNLSQHTASVTILSEADGNAIKLRCGELWERAESDGKPLTLAQDEVGAYIPLTLNAGESQTVVFTLRESPSLYINGKAMDGTCFLQDGRLYAMEAAVLNSGRFGAEDFSDTVKVGSRNYVGIRAASEGRGYPIDWNEEERAVYVTALDPFENRTVTLKSMGRSVGVADDSTENNAAIVLTDSEASTAWKMYVNGLDAYFLENVHSGKSIDIPGASRDAGKGATQYTSNQAANQTLRLIAAEGGGYYLQFRHSALYADVSSGSMVQSAFTGSAGQTFTIEVIE